MTSSLDRARDTLPLLGRGLGDFADRYDVVLCDVWGVIHNGVAQFRPAVDALRRFRQAGGTVVLITNAPAPAAKVVERLDTVGVPRDAFDAIATSGDVTVAMIVEAGCPPVLGIGPLGELALYHEAERIGPRRPRLVGVDEAELVVAIGLADHMGTQPQDYDGLLRKMLERDLAMVCANPDIVVEVGDTLEYCAGAIAERYESIGGRVMQAGKPYPQIYARALSLAEQRRGAIAKSRILAIGDAMHTDMQGAADAGFDALFITSGIHRAELHGARRQDPLDQAALRQFLGTRHLRPMAAMGQLAW